MSERRYTIGSDKLKVLLVIDPMDDLPNARMEGAKVQEILKSQVRVELKKLPGREATKAAFLRELAKADVLHYCGHAFFNGPGEDESGLILANGQYFTLADIPFSQRSETMPRLAFVNACEAGRVRGVLENEAASFAEFFLRGGVECYIGTFWPVHDDAASMFAGDVYTQLAFGQSLDQSVLIARQNLEAAKKRDWANYLVYGDGRFRLSRR